jgi:GYF domain 2
MSGGWYYAHEDQPKLGPYSGEVLKELAASGTILPTDTVWKAGVEEGVEAHLVKNLFAAPAAPVAPVIVKLESNGDEGTIPFADEAMAKEKTSRPKLKTRATATAVKGATIVSQDGVDARYRMMCSKCGHADSSCRTIKIMPRTTKSGFFCPKCKKRREVVIQGRVS